MHAHAEYMKQINQTKNENQKESNRKRNTERASERGRGPKGKDIYERQRRWKNPRNEEKQNVKGRKEKKGEREL